MTPAADAKRPSLLVVDDDELILELLLEELGGDYDAVGVQQRSEVPRALRQLGSGPDYALVDLGLPPHTDSPREGLALVRELLAAKPDCAVVVVSGQSQEEHGKIARAFGALEYIAKPCEPQQIRKVLEQARATRAAGSGEHGLLGDSAAIARLRLQIRQFGPAPLPVLVEGESGTGKELVARALHKASGRDGAFVAVNCAAVPDQLFEASLFGARRGSYTGATADMTGLLAAAEAGTLLLDEIGDLDPALQPKLLRVLESGEYYRVGDSQPRHADVRVVAATNRALRRAIAAGAFREDLYHRLGVLTIQTPPLRETGADRAALLDSFRARAAANSGTEPFALDAEAAALWERYTFPGNVRELHNMVARLQVLHPGATVTRSELAAHLFADPDDAPGGATLDALLEADARAHAKAALAACGDASSAAVRLGISEGRLRELL